MIIALRLCFADVGLVLSTRERAELRDNLIKLGITRMSAGSKTNPGGYSGHSGAIEQFEIDDNRTPAQVAAMIERQGFEPVWKNWVALCTGMRRGELLNTAWWNIDFDRQTIDVSPQKDIDQAWEWHIKDTDRRTLPLTEQVLLLLTKHYEQQPEGYPLHFRTSQTL